MQNCSRSPNPKFNVEMLLSWRKAPESVDYYPKLGNIRTISNVFGTCARGECLLSSLIVKIAKMKSLFGCLKKDNKFFLIFNYFLLFFNVKAKYLKNIIFKVFVIFLNDKFANF